MVGLATKKISKPVTKSQSHSRATWVFGAVLLLFTVWVFVFAPDTLPEYKQRMLGIFHALLAGLFAFFLTGDIGLEIDSIESRFGKVGVKATGDDSLNVLLIAGRPQREPIVCYGPFVMNTREEIAQAIEDYRKGRIGNIAHR